HRRPPHPPPFPTRRSSDLLIPRYFCETGHVCEEGQDNATQVGMNLVTAGAGLAQLSEPFTAFGLPDDRFDGKHRYATLNLVSTRSEGDPSDLRSRADLVCR